MGKFHIGIARVEEAHILPNQEDLEALFKNFLIGTNI
jgi:hypothetical protein